MQAFLDQRRCDDRRCIVDPVAADALQDAHCADLGAEVGLRLDLTSGLARLPLGEREPLLLVGRTNAPRRWTSPSAR